MFMLFFLIHFLPRTHGMTQNLETSRANTAQKIYMSKSLEARKCDIENKYKSKLNIPKWLFKKSNILHRDLS